MFTTLAVQQQNLRATILQASQAPGVNQQAICEDMIAEAEHQHPGISITFPTQATLRSSQSRAARAARPPIPTLENLNDIHIPEEYAIMTPPHGAPPAQFLLHKRSEINPDTQRRSGFVVFGINSFVEKLCQADEISVDGTFKVAPEPFVRLLCVCFFYTRHAGAASTRKLFCGLQVLLSDKTQFLYSQVIAWIREYATTLQAEHNWPNTVRWQRAMMDFEDALINGLQASFPNVTVSGCFFHFMQCIWSAIGRYGFATLYKQQGPFNEAVRKFRSLMLLPPERVVQGYDALVADMSAAIEQVIPQDQQQALVAFNNYLFGWINTPAKVASCNVRNLLNHRTNNDLEGYNRRLNSRISQHADFWTFIKELQKEQFKQMIQYRQVCRGGALRAQRAQVRDNEQTIQDLQTDLDMALALPDVHNSHNQAILLFLSAVYPHVGDYHIVHQLPEPDDDVEAGGEDADA